MTVDVHVIGGFLGAGKTTTLLHLIESLGPEERIAVVVNEFGQSAIDQHRVGERGLTLQEIRGACVCCTAPEGFLGAVRALLDEVRPTRILVEPTGLARPADLIDTLRRAPWREEIAVGPLVVVVDPAVLLDAPEAQRLKAQAQVADVLVVNRLDLATEEQQERIETWLAGLWPAPLRIVRTSYGRVDPSVLRWPPGTGPRLPAQGVLQERVPEEGVHGHLARTWVWPPEVAFHRARLLQTLDELAPRVARLKGFIRTQEGMERVEIAGQRVHTAPSDWRRDSRLDLIASLQLDLDAVQGSLQAAQLRPDEAAASGEVLEVAGPDGSARRYDRAALQGLAGQLPDVSALIPGRQGAAVRLASVLGGLGALKGEAQAVVVAADGFTTAPVPLAALDTAVLVHSLGDDPLPAKLGGPFRLLIPGDAGPGGPCANVKAVVRIAVRAGA